MRVWLCELIHKQSGEVVRTSFTLDVDVTTKDEVPGYTWRTTEMVPASQAAESRRLDWLLQHRSAEFDRDGAGSYVVAYLTSGDAFSGGVSGHFVGRGATGRDCIDAFLSGKIMRAD